MKTIDDAVRDLNGDVKNAILVDVSPKGLLWWDGKTYAFAYPKSLAAKHETIICTRAQFDRRAAVMGYWVDWDATETSKCPVGPSTIVEVQLKDGSRLNDRAGKFWWDPDDDCGGEATITRYRVVQPETKSEPEQLDGYWDGEWLPCEFVTEHNGSKIYAIYAYNNIRYQPLTDDQVRTRLSERERWIEVASEAADMLMGNNTRTWLERIYDAGLAKMPEDV